MSNVMQQIKLKNSTSRDAFDLSHRNPFTAKIGELLPVSCQEVLPGDSFDLEISHFTRTQPVNTAAYTRMREYYDWFFVPTDLLWNKFNTFVTQMFDNNQHAVGINSRQVLTDTHPYFTLNQIHDRIRKYATYNSSNMFGFPLAQTSRKLLEYLDYGNFAKSADVNGGTFTSIFENNLNLNPFPLLAYQKIYSDYFRNSQWETAYAPSFNIDYISGELGSLNIPISDISEVGVEHMFTLRYANWHKDLFMGLLPNSQYGAAATVNIPNMYAYSIRNLGNVGTSNQNVVLNQVGDLTNNYATDTSLAAAWQIKGLGQDKLSELGILALRQAEALQKWQEITQSNQQDYKSQIEAHFGVSPDNGYSDRCIWIGGHVSNLDISEVTNNNITGANAADIAGKGVGVGQGQTKFKSKVHGYLMCIYHCAPLLDYSSAGISRINLKTKATDYAIPEFDRTGMVSVPLVELTNSVGTETLNNRLMGYAPRYYEYKQNLDKVHGGFTTGLSSWVAPMTDSYFKNYLTGNGNAPISYIFFKINPSVMNPIFALNADGTYETDQLLVNASFDIKAVRNLDRNGLPY